MRSEGSNHQMKRPCKPATTRRPSHANGEERRNFTRKEKGLLRFMTVPVQSM
jgi:hypothetical protein